MDSVIDVELVRVTQNDLLPLIQYVEAYFSFDRLDFSSKVRTAIAHLVKDPTLGAYFFITNQSVRVGYLALTYGFDAEAGGRIGVITDFYLIETARGKGVGQLAMKNLLTITVNEGLNEVDLVVIEGNDRAERLYASLGFTRTTGRFWMAKVL